MEICPGDKDISETKINQNNGTFKIILFKKRGFERLIV